MINKQINYLHYCCEDISKIENYEEAINSNEVYACHHRLETHNSNGEKRLVDLTRKELIALDMYYNRPASELIFMKNSEHMSLHNKDRKLSDEHKSKIGMAGIGRKYSKESRKKMSESEKKSWTDERRRNLREFNSIYKSKRVLCVETNEVYDSLVKAAIATGINRGQISHAVTGINKTACGYHWEYA